MATRRLVVEIVGDASGLQRTFRGASADSTRLGGSLGRLSIGLGQLVKGVVVVEAVQKALEGLSEAAHLGIEGFADTTRVAAQTAAVIKSTGDASNLSAKQIHALAASLSNVSGIDDEVIQSGENVLSSFTQIRDFAGKNNDIFTRATKVVTDYASRTGKSATTSATIIGRALADPATKAVALSRAGIVLTKSQLAALKQIEKTSGVVAAQKVLLSDLETRYQGAAAAAGKTLPGQLNILRERFKDLAGELVGDVVPAFSSGIKGLTDFVVKLTDAKGAHAKFEIVVDGIKGLGQKLGQLYVAELKIARKALDAGVAALGKVDWRSVIAKLGRDAGEALAATFNKLADFLDRVNFNQVGQTIVKDLGKAIGAIVLFLKSVDWSSVAKATLRLLVASFRAQQNLMAGIGEAIGKALLNGIGRGLDAIGPAIEAKAIKIVLGIIDPFTHIPSILGPEGDLARKAKDSLHATLDGLNAPSTADGAAIGENIFAGIVAGVNSQGAALTAAVQAAIAKSQAAGAGSRNTAGPAVQSLPAVPKQGNGGGLNATQRNTFFDNAISSDLTRAGFITNVKEQIGALQTIAGLISARIAATKDVTRRRTLEDQLLSVQSQIKGDQAQVASDFLSSLQLGITKAQATASFTDDIAAFTALENGIKAQIKATGTTADLQQQLFDAQQGLTGAKTSQLQAKQFKALGLGPTGDKLTPGLTALRKSLGTVSAAVKGTFLDTKANRSLFATIQQELIGHFGKLSDLTRQTIAKMLGDIDKQLKDHANGPLTKTTALNVNKILGAAGLDTTQEKILRARLSHFNSAGVALAGTGSGSAGPRQTIVVQSPDIYMDKTKVSKKVSGVQRKNAARNPSQRRGPNAGLVIS